MSAWQQQRRRPLSAPPQIGDRVATAGGQGTVVAVACGVAKAALDDGGTWIGPPDQLRRLPDPQP